MKSWPSFKFWTALLSLILAALLTGCAQAPQPSVSAPSPSPSPSFSSSPAPAPSPAPPPSRASVSQYNATKSISQSDARLGTQWGESISSSITTVPLNRVSNTPIDVALISYSSRSGKGHAINEAMFANGRVGVSILNDRHGKWPLTQDGQQIHLRGVQGEQYQILYRSYSDQTYEIVTTVDGLDVINGQAGSINNRGYVLYPHQTVLIDGFRKNKNEVAAFRFSAVDDAYAANTPAGSAANTGVIGTAVFVLDAPRQNDDTPRQPSRNAPQAFPGDNDNRGYAPPPSYQQ